MNRMLLVVFDTPSQADAGALALHELHTLGSLSLYALGIVTLDAQGHAHLGAHSSQAPVSTGVGLAVGSLLGLMGGPLGLAVGAVAGTVAGALHDFWVAGVSLDFVEEALRVLKPGKVALIAEVDEDEMLPVDARMQACGGTVIRRSRTEVLQSHFEQDIKLIRTEVADLEEELGHATGTGRELLQRQLDSANARLSAAVLRARERADALEAEADIKVAALKAQLAVAQGEARSTLERRMRRVRHSYDARVSLLSQAWDLTRAALTP